MKKICYITTVSTTLKAFVVDVGLYLHKQGNFDITFICDSDVEFAKGLPSCIKYIPVPMKRGISISGIIAVFKLYSIFIKENFDLVQYSTPNASLYASIAAKLARVPVRLYCQWGIVYVGFSGFKRKLFKLVEKTICKLSTWIEPDSFGNLSFSWSEGLYAKNKSSVVWNGSASGVNLKKFNITHKDNWRKEIRNKHSIGNDTFVIGYVGRITKDKGINELFSSCRMFFEKHSNSILMLVGDNEKPESIDEELYRWSIDEKRVIYCGRTSEVEKYLSAMDVFVLPSYREGFGTVVIEAEAMGVPVIITNIPGPTDAMVSNETGLIVEKGSSHSLLSAIDKIESERAMRSNMSKSAVAFVKGKFDQDILFKKIKEDREIMLNKLRGD